MPLTTGEVMIPSAATLRSPAGATRGATQDQALARDSVSQSNAVGPSSIEEMLSQVVTSIEAYEAYRLAAARAELEILVSPAGSNTSRRRCPARNMSRERVAAA